jgi:hypothetical protein
MVSRVNRNGLFLGPIVIVSRANLNGISLDRSNDTFGHFGV